LKKVDLKKMIRNKFMKMKRNNLIIAATALSLFFALDSYSKEDQGRRPATNSAHGRGMANGGVNTLDNSCSPATAKTDLDINNVRTKILSGGDMWWDLTSAKYEVPKGGGAHSIFAGSLWIGGLDAGGQLKVAAATYRQNGNDYWPGPLDTVNVSISGDQCQKYDQHYKITLKEVEQFNGWFSNPSDPAYAGYTIPLSISNWPAHGDQSKNQARFLAPFHDAVGDGQYSPSNGDYPDFDLSGQASCGWRLYGDEALWWVFNDKGNIHTETNAQAIGLEIQAVAFAFSTNDEINNMTFYKYKVINRSSYAMEHTWFGQWIDMDLGKYDDDYVGCDVGRGLGYTYNGAMCDGTGGPGQYGCQPPACGCDFFQGPIADPFDGVDNNRNGIIDEPNEQIIMSQFIYYNNDFNPVNGNPRTGTHYYNYLKGYWGDGTHMTYGGNGVNTGVPCQFMFPGTSDPTGWGTNRVPQPAWTEASAGNAPGDRRFMQSAGSFTLQPGAVNYITTGIVWARATSGGPAGSVSLLRLVDDKAQALFDNCFKVLNGPTAPDVTIQEMDKELILRLDNKPSPLSNNYMEKYAELDPQIQAVDTFNFLLKDSFKFEGYEIFQLHDAFVSASDLDNIDKARLVAQCDEKNGVSRIINFVPNNDLGGAVPQEMVVGADKGIQHTFDITTDAFALNDRRLVNQKTYYYMAIAYGYNNFIPYQQDQPFQASSPLNASLAGQKLPYKRGRQNIKLYSAIPHIPAPQHGGTVIQGGYGSGPMITRINGNGNGGNVLDLTPASTAAILAAPAPTHRLDNVQYVGGAGPVNIKVIDPLNVPVGNFSLYFHGASSLNVLNPTAVWTLYNEDTGDSTSLQTPISVPHICCGNAVSSNAKANQSIAVPNEQIFPNWGISLTITQPTGTLYAPGDNTYDFLEGTMTFTDDTKNWLSGIPDVDGYSDFNWIRGGTQKAVVTTNCDVAFDSYSGTVGFLDAKEQYSKILGGTWAPYRLCSSSKMVKGSFCNLNGPADTLMIATYATLNKMQFLPSVDIVITNDQSKWSRCPVFELSDQASLAEGNARKFDLRNTGSVDKTGAKNFPSTDNNDFANGMGWFPGYAINVETGERLNIAFGEDSWLAGYHGRDMMWNPTSDVFDQLMKNVWGGKHYIYVFGHNRKYFPNLSTTDPNQVNVPAYDGGAFIHDKLNTHSQIDRRNVFKDCEWVGIPMLVPGQTLRSTDVKIRLRVSRPYMNDLNLATDSMIGNPNNLSAGNRIKPWYKFSTANLTTLTNNWPAASKALDLINIVPNPYYAYSSYETDKLSNLVKITNLPGKCTINIYTISGILVRQYKKDNDITYQDWDLKNTAGIPIASGLYIIHVDVPGVGHKILKWFGVARPLDLESF
jgi:hypothetical protein